MAFVDGKQFKMCIKDAAVRVLYPDPKIDVNAAVNSAMKHIAISIKTP